MIHLVLGLVWAVLALALFLWKSLPDANAPNNANVLIGGATVLAVFNFLRWGVRWIKGRPPTREVPTTERPPAPEVKNPEFDFSDREGKE